MTWLSYFSAVCGITALVWTVLREVRYQRQRGTRVKAAELRSRVDQLHAELHAKEPAKVIVGPWMLETDCPDCGARFDRPRIVTDQRCEPCKAKAWHAQELADREQWEKSPGVIKQPDGREIVMSDALIIRKDWGK